MNKEEINFKVQKSRFAILQDEAFFAYILMHTQMVVDNSIPTMATNGRFIYYSESFVDKLDVREIKTVICHEILHCALSHHLRRQARENTRWNYACDYIINSEIEKLNKASQQPGPDKRDNIPFVWPKPPFAPLLDDKYKDKSAEEVYNLLPEENSKEGQKLYGKGCGMGEVIDSKNEDGKPLNKEEKDKLEVEIKQLVCAAANIAKGKGNLPSSLKRFVEELIEPKKSWRDILKEFFLEMDKSDYTWLKPNRRYLSSGFILPSLNTNESLGELIIVIDTSGSIHGPLLKEFLSELNGIIYQCKPSKTILIDCDASIQSVREFEADEDIPNTFGGGGGTSFKPPVKYAEKNGLNPLAMIYFTDLCGEFPDKEPNYPILWVVPKEYSNIPVPFGTIIELE